MFHTFLRIDDIFDNDEYNSDFDPETRNKDKGKDNDNVSCVNTKCDVDPLFRAPCKDIDKDKDKDKEEDKDEGRVEF